MELANKYIVDACKTYEFTWAIREASEKKRNEIKAKGAK
jgi:hypothetical protein